MAVEFHDLRPPSVKRSMIYIDLERITDVVHDMSLPSVTRSIILARIVSGTDRKCEPVAALKNRGVWVGIGDNLEREDQVSDLLYEVARWVT
jgi:hypothetical protein